MKNQHSPTDYNKIFNDSKASKHLAYFLGHECISVSEDCDKNTSNEYMMATSL